MKGIIGYLGEMTTPLKPNAKTVKQRLCRVNPRYKENVKIELDIMLGTCIIELVEKFEWFIPMVV